MEIELINVRSLVRKRYLKTIMKIFIFLMCTTVFCLAPKNSFSQEKITIEKDQLVTPDYVFKIIKKQTNLNFVYPKAYFKNSPKIQLKKGEIKASDLIDKVLQNSDLGFELTENNTIIIKETPKVQVKDNPMSQTKQITGQVLDESGVPLPGATVIEVGTTNGTTTDFDGNFSLDVSSEESNIEISYIGFQSQTVTVGTDTQINITMVEDAQGLDEVVVVGYGTKSKKNLTNSVATVQGDVLQQTPSVNVAANLQGRLPGLTASQRTGEPGNNDPVILIRGRSTIGGGSDEDDNNDANAPLVIIDGVQRGNLGQLNPDDIENISVLKDASAAIYGARAANGVILVTTKKGRSGRPTFNLSFDTAISKPTLKSDVLDAVTYAQAFNEAAPGTFSDAAIQRYADGSDPIRFANTDWVDETLKGLPLQQRFSFSASGGSEKIRYLMSYSYLNQEGNYVNNRTNFRQQNARVNVEADLTDNLTFGANLSGIINQKEFTSQGTGTNFINILLANPTLVARYPNGLLGPGRLGQSPLLLDRRGFRNQDETPIFTTFTAAYKIPFIKGLRLDASFNYDQDNQTNKTWDLPYSYSTFNTDTEEFDEVTIGATPRLTERYDKFTTLLYNFRLTYEKTFGDHSVLGMIGQEQQQNKASFVQAFRQNFVSPAIAEINVGSTAPEDKDNNGSSSETAYNNFLGRLNYNYKSKYLLDFVFRYDGSQNFPDGNRYGFFPAVSGAWNISEESFIKDNLSFVDNLKLRVSYGQAGNDRIAAFQFLQAFNFNNNYVFGTTDVPGVSAGTLPNPDVTWEVSTKTDVGLEATLFGGKLGTELTLFREQRTDILVPRDLSTPQIVGFPELPDENIGEVDSHGFEFVLTHQNTIGELNYSFNGNVAFATSEVVFIDETPNQEDYQNQTGLPIGAELFYQTDGIINTQEELDASPNLSEAQLGDLKIIDVNGDGEINDLDRVRFDKTATPEWIFGLNTNFRYKNLDVNLFFQGQTGAFNYDSRLVDLSGTDQSNSFVQRAENRWSATNPNGTMPRSRFFNPGESEFFLLDATFVRLKSAEIGYSFPQDLVSKIGLKNCRLYISGSNLLTWAKEIEHVDPEINGNGTTYPQLRIINYGINVNF